MSESPISESKFANGLWTGFLQKGGDQSDTPEVGVFLGALDLGDVAATADGDSLWKLEFSIPADLLGEGISTFVFVDRNTSEPLGRFCIIAGTAAEQDVLAHLDALQSELNQLKSAFRREARRNRDGL